MLAFDGTTWSPTPWQPGTMTGPPDDLWIVSRFAGGSAPEGGQPSFWGWQASHFDGRSTTAFAAPIPTTDQYYRGSVLLTAPAERVGAVDIRDGALVYEEWDGAAWGELSVLASGVHDQANTPPITQLGDGHRAALVGDASSASAWLVFLEYISAAQPVGTIHAFRRLGLFICAPSHAYQGRAALSGTMAEESNERAPHGNDSVLIS
jgi:hypothetical protein